MNSMNSNKDKWRMVIGLEVHVQLSTKTKMFTSSEWSYGESPNTQICPITLGYPGSLPTINKSAVKKGIMIGLSLNCDINKETKFARKHYFYPDLPKGYQISQFKSPIVGEGWINIDLDKGETKKIGIERLHLEQDAGKLMHDQHPRFSFVDLNRSGIPLMEIVSKPDMRDWEEAGAYLRKLRSIVRYIGSCDGNMDQGSLRCDANISVRKPGEEFGTRCELKNINSVKFMMKAVEYEAYRQIEIIENGGEVKQETRLYDPNKNETRSMRSKEEAHTRQLLHVILTDIGSAQYKSATDIPVAPVEGTTIETPQHDYSITDDDDVYGDYEMDDDVVASEPVVVEAKAEVNVDDVTAVINKLIEIFDAK